MTGVIMPLERELATYQANLADWLKSYSGKFALVVGDKLEGVFDTPQNAYAVGVGRFGNIPMLIKQIREAQDEAAFFPALTLGLINASLHV
jgi:hypothetical protein